MKNDASRSPIPSRTTPSSILRVEASCGTIASADRCIVPPSLNYSTRQPQSRAVSQRAGKCSHHLFTQEALKSFLRSQAGEERCREVVMSSNLSATRASKRRDITSSRLRREKERAARDLLKMCNSLSLWAYFFYIRPPASVTLIYI